MIKINLELPEFEKELCISVTLKKDGEVITTSSSSPGVITEVSESQKMAETEKSTTIRKKKPQSGNLMDMSF